MDQRRYAHTHHANVTVQRFYKTEEDCRSTPGLGAMTCFFLGGLSQAQDWIIKQKKH